MRTDAKVGLVCALALLIAIVAYFALHKDNTPVKSPSEGTSLATTPPAPTPDTPPAPPATPAPAPAYASDTTPFIAPPATGPAPAGPLVVNPPHSLLPTTNPAPAGLTSTNPAPYTPPLVDNNNPVTPGRTSTEVPSNDRPRDDSSLLEHNPPRPTIGESFTGSAGTYTIQAGDTLAAIAKKNGLTLKALQAANPKVDPTHLKIKQVIKLPAPTAPSSSTPATPATPTSPTTRPAHHHPGTVAPATPSTGSTAAAANSYTVKKGDTLRKIAKSVYGDESQWKRIFHANRDQLDSADDIDPGMVLKIPSKQ